MSPLVGREDEKIQPHLVCISNSGCSGVAISFIGSSLSEADGVWSMNYDASGEHGKFSSHRGPRAKVNLAPVSSTCHMVFSTSDHFEEEIDHMNRVR